MNGDQMNSKNRKPCKVAVIRAFLPGQREVNARGCGRSARTAATRALLNFLGHRFVRRRRLAAVQIELSIANAVRDRGRADIQSGGSV
jgi:hypothetical protein